MVVGRGSDFLLGQFGPIFRGKFAVSFREGTHLGGIKLDAKISLVILRDFEILCIVRLVIQ